jgi:hypothetical protein
VWISIDTGGLQTSSSPNADVGLLEVAVRPVWGKSSIVKKSRKMLTKGSHFARLSLMLSRDYHVTTLLALSGVTVARKSDMGIVAA